MQITYSGLEQFLQGLLDADSFQEYVDERKKSFPTWQHVWQILEPWLRQHTFQTMYDTIMSLAQIIPNMSAYKYQLHNSLHLHDSFWKQVYANLVIAKDRLSC